MTSSHSIAVTTALGLGLTFATAGWATPVSDACAALGEARTSLYSMLHAKDRSAQDALKAKVQAASTKVDAAVASMGNADAKMIADFNTIWDQFKATRDNEIIPAIYNGNIDDARKVANGVQFQRLSRMWSILSCSR
jgi:hypothetical protein